MLEPDVTLTDYALAAECAGFAVVLGSRLRAGAGDRISALFLALFAALSASSVLGASYHGFFSATPSPRGEGLWLLTLLVIGFVAFFTWLVAAEIQLSAAGQRVVMALAALELVGYALYVISVSRDFRVASITPAWRWSS